MHAFKIKDRSGRTEVLSQGLWEKILRVPNRIHQEVTEGPFMGMGSTQGLKASLEGCFPQLVLVTSQSIAPGTV